jgi:hypothetical protein
VGHRVPLDQPDISDLLLQAKGLAGKSLGGNDGPPVFLAEAAETGQAQGFFLPRSFFTSAMRASHLTILHIASRNTAITRTDLWSANPIHPFEVRAHEKVLLSDRYVWPERDTVRPVKIEDLAREQIARDLPGLSVRGIPCQVT